ncbi:MAG: hypothetical protein ACOCQR_03185 [bacterium]
MGKIKGTKVDMAIDGFKVNLHTYVDVENHQDSFFHQGHIGEVKKSGVNIVAGIIATGEIKIVDQNYQIVHNGLSAYNGGREEEFETDELLYQNVGNEGMEESKYWWIDNNWFEIVLIDTDKKEIVADGLDWVAHTVNEAIELAIIILKEELPLYEGNDKVSRAINV